LRGVRIPTAYADVPIFSQPPHAALKAILRNARIREGAKILGQLGLTWDIWVFHDQLGDVAEFASALPHTQIILNHSGTPSLTGSSACQRDPLF
jgi:predicted TIM-barrel fold metal-dependent hydrolase